MYLFIILSTTGCSREVEKLRKENAQLKRKVEIAREEARKQKEIAENEAVNAIQAHLKARKTLEECEKRLAECK